MFLDQVFVFTPKGQLITLPRGAMPLDFAFAVHTEVGETAVGVKINGELKPMRTQLVNGDVVEIIRGAKREVPVDWRSLTVTGRARSSIRRTIRSSEREEFHKLGRTTLEQTLSRAGKKLSDLALAPVLETLSIETEDALFEAIGRGQVQATRVVEMLFPALKGQVKVAHDRRRIEESEAQLYVRGSGLTPGISIHFGHCCSPLPGDRIVGILEPERGLTVHTIDCGRLVEFSDDDSLWQDLQWTPRRAAIS